MLKMCVSFSVTTSRYRREIACGPVHMSYYCCCWYV